MSSKPLTFRRQTLSDEQLEMLRAQIETFDTVDQIDPEIRDMVTQRWPNLLAKMTPKAS